MEIAATGPHHPVAAWIAHGEVFVAEVDLAAGTLREAVRVNGEVEAFTHPIERPGVAVRGDGVVDLAFTSASGEGRSVYVTTWDRERLLPPVLVSGPPRPETNLVHLTAKGEGRPVVAWLEDSTLSLALPQERGFVEEEEVDSLTCDCCDPVPLFLEGSLVVGYRDLERERRGVARDIVVVRSPDGGASFAEPVPVQDDHWYLDACPFSGPSLAAVDGELVVAWMDARQSVHPDHTESTIWIDVSSNGGASFGEDRAVTSGGLHHRPVLAADLDGGLHLLWETLSPSSGIAYARSDGPRSPFQQPVLLVEEKEGGGRPQAPSVLVQNGHLLVGWVDRQGAHLDAWPLDG